MKWRPFTDDLVQTVQWGEGGVRMDFFFFFSFLLFDFLSLINVLVCSVFQMKLKSNLIFKIFKFTLYMRRSLNMNYCV